MLQDSLILFNSLIKCSLKFYGLEFLMPDLWLVISLLGRKYKWVEDLLDQPKSLGTLIDYRNHMKSCFPLLSSSFNLLKEEFIHEAWFTCSVFTTERYDSNLLEYLTESRKSTLSGQISNPFPGSHFYEWDGHRIITILTSWIWTTNF